MPTKTIEKPQVSKLDFKKFRNAVSKQFDQMAKGDLFCAEVAGDDLWANYLASFPPGTNPIYRERTEYDCSCCRSFIKQVGSVVTVVNGKLTSLWDVKVDEPAFQAVCDSMSAMVKDRAIANVFLHPEYHAGTEQSLEMLDSGVTTYNHFYVKIPHGSNSGKNYFCPRKDIAAKLGDRRAHHDVLLRSLTELTQDSVDTVLELIGQNSLYRGAEYKFVVEEFSKLKRKFDKLKTDDPFAWSRFAWSHIDSVPGSVSKIRNTGIGTLLVDLSEGTDLEVAVKKFETSIMAPSNYKRPTALVSQKMVDQAKAKLEELGLTSALERRYAKLQDISVRDVIFADRRVKKVMKDDPFDGVATKTTVPKNLDKVETVTIQKFIDEIVPKAESIELFFDNKHRNNLVSLIAPVHLDAKPLFKWNNNFSWSYTGDFADSIKERVKKAGGNVTGDLCCRLAWYNYDDLDFHLQEPKNGGHIHFANRKNPNTEGQLDVDMNAGGRHESRTPVENIFFPRRSKMLEGVYALYVNQFSKQESKDGGFEVEIDFMGEVFNFTYDKSLRNGENVQVAEFEYTHKGDIRFIRSLDKTSASKTVWNTATQDFRPVSVFLTSPNHWDGEKGVGNKHYFFMLEGCVNDGQARGFYNEFLRDELTPHRKVIEIVGSKMKTAETPNQLSGLGFSDTTRAEVLVRVKGSFTRTLKVTI